VGHLPRSECETGKTHRSYRVYTIPGDLFPVPTGYVWIFTARLVTGKGLPPMAKEWALAFAVIFAILTLARAVVTLEAVGPRVKRWMPKKALLPGGIAVAVGSYMARPVLVTDPSLL
jgi:uncharacterized oligopeptide transporter (OPT) family protein